MDYHYTSRWKIKDGLTREDIKLELEKTIIESRPLWKPMHTQPISKDCPYYGGNISEKLFNDGLCLPSGSNLKKVELLEISKNIQRLF